MKNSKKNIEVVFGNKNNDILKKNASNISALKASLHTKVNLYKKKAAEIEEYLLKRPEEWGKFQSEFNSEINSIFREIMNFEKNNVINGDNEKVYKLRRIFVNRVRRLFTKKGYGKWCLNKPYGYAGDFKIIDDIYQNSPSTSSFDRLFDNYFQMSAISVAVRNRKEDFKNLVMNFANKNGEDLIRIMDLGSGPCRDVKELLSSDELLNRNVIFDCYDHDEKALNFARSLLVNFSNVNFIKENALRLAATKDVGSRIHEKYNIIYSTGLFDYLSDKIATRLIRNLRKVLKAKGILAVSSVRDKYSNPSVHYMEWMGEWNLIYREDEELKKIFIDAGFKKDLLKTMYEQQGIMQYVVASNE